MQIRLHTLYKFLELFLISNLIVRYRQQNFTNEVSILRVVWSFTLHGRMTLPILPYQLASWIICIWTFSIKISIIHFFRIQQLILQIMSIGLATLVPGNVQTSRALPKHSAIFLGFISLLYPKIYTHSIFLSMGEIVVDDILLYRNQLLKWSFIRREKISSQINIRRWTPILTTLHTLLLR